VTLFNRNSQDHHRRRTLSKFDSSLRRAIRKVEQRIKFLLASPLGLLLTPKRARTPLPLSEVSSILILRYDALGDAVLTTPVWRWLKQHAPHVRIGVAASVRNRSLLAADPDIDEVYVFSRTISLRLIRELFRARKSKWDVVINPFFHDKTRGAIFSKIIAPHGISATLVRDRKEKYERLYSVVGDRPPLTPPTPMVQQVLLLLKEAIDIPADIDSVMPSLPEWPEIAEPYSRKIESLMHEFGKKDYIIINTDASQLYKEWGLENSLALAKRIIGNNPNHHVFLTSAPERAEPVRQLIPAEQKDISYLHTPSILHLSVAVRGAVAVVSPDTSVIHFATAQQVPIVGLYLEENEFLPYGSTSRVLFAPDRKQASLISVEDVFNALLEILALRV
jgi:ADP-heptose:LPS heptosyltransferase